MKVLGFESSDLHLLFFYYNFHPIQQNAFMIGITL